jgi:hypothetical protein
MEKNLHDIDKLFHSYLEKHEEEPTEDVWVVIENDLNRADAETYKAKYKFLLRTVLCIVFLISALLLNDIMQTYTRNLKRNNTGIEGLKAKPSAENNPIENTTNNNTPDHGYVTIPFNDNLNTIKKDVLKNKRESENNIFFQDNKFYDYHIVQVLNSLVLFNKKNKNLLPPVNFDSVKLIYFSGQAAAKNLMDDKQQNNLEHLSGQLKPEHDFYLIPLFSYDIVTARLQEQYKYDSQDRLAVSNREKPDASYSLGLLAEYQLSKKYSLQMGISLSNSFTSIDSTVVRAMPDNLGAYKFKLATTYGLAEIKRTGINPQNGDSIRLSDASLHLQYISMPVTIKRQIKGGNFKISGLTGIAINRIINEKMEVEYVSNTNTETENVEKIEGLKKTFITFIAGAEANYTINKRVSIGISPNIHYSLTPVNQGTPVKTFPITFRAAALIKIKM